MAKSRAKAKSNKKQKQNEDPGRNALEPDEYVVGTLPVPTPARTRILSASLEKVLQAKVNVIQKTTIHWVSALLHRPLFPAF